ncbi:unnamed protein product [Cunninghamella blakesleeana]
MIQTTLFNYFACNGTNKLLKQPICKPSLLLFRQTKLSQYFKTIPKKRNLILNYFKPKEEKEKEKIFNLVLVDITETWQNNNVKCVKKNMYDPDIKYVAISYRWGEEREQLLKTPDYTAHITSFDLHLLYWLCRYINHEPDLKDIPYLWIDAISVDQQNHARKKDTILKMNQIYKKASYILAVPDLHEGYLRKNTANYEILKLIWKYKNRIRHDIFSTVHLSTVDDNIIEHPTQHTNNDCHYSEQNSTHEKIINENEELRNEFKEIVFKKESEELKKVYQFLAYLVYDWSNRAWVISEYQIAKEKYKQNGTLLKYIFISLLSYDYVSFNFPFFSYTFTGQNKENSNMIGCQYLHYAEITNSNKFIRFLELRFTERPHMDMMIKSNANRNEDRFYAILSSWNKCKHLVKNKNTISNWKINDMVSIKLKLYEIMNDDGDLWDKARLLLYSSFRIGKPILPSFAAYHDPNMLLGEKDCVDLVHKELIECISEFKDGAKQYIDDYKKKHGTIFKQNLIEIKYHQQQCSLYIKASKCFLFNIPSLSSLGFSQRELSDYLLQDNDSLRLVYISYFTYDIPEISDLFSIDSDSYPILAGTLLLVEYYRCGFFGKPSLISVEDNYLYLCLL